MIDRFSQQFAIYVLFAIAAGIMVVTGPREAWGATIRVAADGTGDYTSLFDGIDAAQDGDTVSIAPGEYTEPQWTNPSGLFAFEAMGIVWASNVTVIGDDRDAVRIGPATSPPVLQGDDIWGLGAANGAGGVIFESMTLRNLSQAIFDGDSAPTIRDCRFVGNDLGVSQFGLGRFDIRDCEFVDNIQGIVAFNGFGAREVYIADCTFVDQVDEAIQIQSPTSEVANCQITGGKIGISTALGGQLLLHGTTISNASFYGIYIGDGAAASIYTCIFDGAMQYSAFVEGSIIARDVLFGGGSVETLHFGAPFLVDMFGNHILNAGALSVYAGGSQFEPRTIDLSSNWWGTSDLDQIEEWIHHAPDDPTGNGLTVDYVPIYLGPVPVDESSVGALKSSFLRN
ncbi:hypothetical protein DRQ53_07595 [bacterium]|nr:MAG: hypothetical protein DRQ53_07595 [bacterium]